MRESVLEFRKKFPDILDQILRGSKKHRSLKDVFDDFITLNFQLAFIALCNMDLFKHYINLDLIDDISNDYLSKKLTSDQSYLLLEASTLYFKAVQDSEPFDDILGDLYDTHLGKVLGQFFTPKDLAYGLIPLLMEKEIIDEPITIGDVCGCGGGSLILGQLFRIYKDHGTSIFSKVNVCGMDIDLKMAQLASLQILANVITHKIPLKSMEILCGNVITDYNKNTAFLHIELKEDPLLKLFSNLDQLTRIACQNAA